MCLKTLRHHQHQYLSKFAQILSREKIWEKLFTRFLFSLCICVQFQQALSGPWRRWSVLRFNADVRAGAGLSLSQKFPLSKSRRFWYLSLHKICLIILGVGPRVELQLLGWDCQIWIWSISEFRYKIEKYNFICPYIISLISIWTIIRIVIYFLLSIRPAHIQALLMKMWQILRQIFRRKKFV